MQLLTEDFGTSPSQPRSISVVRFFFSWTFNYAAMSCLSGVCTGSLWQPVLAYGHRHMYPDQLLFNKYVMSFARVHRLTLTCHMHYNFYT